MPDPRAELAAIEVEEQRLLAALAEIPARLLLLRAQRQAILDRALAPATPPGPDLLTAEELLARWQESGLPSCPPSVAALRSRLDRAGDTGRRGRWTPLLRLGEQHRVGPVLLWEWGEAEKVIREETGA